MSRQGLPVNPHFIGIGAQKAGTTWLYERMQAHPEVWMPYQKELHYFDERVGQRVTLQSRVRGSRPCDLRWRLQVKHWKKNRQSWSPAELWWWARYFATSRYDDEWYLGLFAPAGDRISGDISPRYALIDSDAISHLHSVLPDARILYFARHPVERAWSQALMELPRRVGPQFGDADLRRDFDAPAAQARASYAETLDRWMECFPPEQIFLGFFEDIVLRPDQLLDTVCDFIGLSHLPSKGDDLRKAANKGRTQAIPARHARYLAQLYLPLAESLPPRLGRYADWWLYSTQQLAGLSDDAEDIPYPFLHGPMFEAWKATAGLPPDETPQLASGRLDQVAARVTAG